MISPMCRCQAQSVVRSGSRAAPRLQRAGVRGKRDEWPFRVACRKSASWRVSVGDMPASSLVLVSRR